jgi:hypothetical protein
MYGAKSIRQKCKELNTDLHLFTTMIIWSEISETILFSSSKVVEDMLEHEITKKTQVMMSWNNLYIT